MDIEKNESDLILVIISSTFIFYGLFGDIFSIVSLFVGLILLMMTFILMVLSATKPKNTQSKKRIKFGRKR